MSRLEAIADPTRLRIVRYLTGRPGASLAALADAAGVHLNTARPHVRALEAVGILERETPVATGRGRPQVEYRLGRGWSPPTTDFHGLAELLATAVLRAGLGRRELRALGLEWGRYLHGRPGAGDVATALPAALERLGFEASVDDSSLQLLACPCPGVLPDRPDLVCELAAGVSEGVLAATGSGLRVAGRKHDPKARQCSLALDRQRRRSTS